ncbi:MAG: flagellar motor switch protein FliN [Dehalococcoidia bacterium]|nr:flagellar motor switch protein FliN [Dehalococcoidia bacterium]
MSDPKSVLTQLLSPAQAESLQGAGRSTWATAAATLESLVGAAPMLADVAARLVMPDEIADEFEEPHLVLPLELTTDLDQQAMAYLVAPTSIAALFFDSMADDPADQEQQTMVVAGTMLSQLVQALNTQVFATWSSGVAVSTDDIQANAMPGLLTSMGDPALALTGTVQAGRPLPFTFILPGTFLDIVAGVVPAAEGDEEEAPAFAGLDPSIGFSLSAEELEAAELIEDEAPPPAPPFTVPVTEPVGAAVSASAGGSEREPTPISAAKARFAPLPEPEPAISRSGIDLLAALRMNVTVELGRTQLTVAEVLGLGPGSVVELDRLAGEPVDIRVNDRLIARGEVVVVDENFGVRITEVLRRGQESEEQAS